MTLEQALMAAVVSLSGAVIFLYAVIRSDHAACREREEKLNKEIRDLLLEQIRVNNEQASATVKSIEAKDAMSLELRDLKHAVQELLPKPAH